MNTTLFQKAAALRNKVIHDQISTILDNVRADRMDKGTAKLHLDRLTREVLKPVPSPKVTASLGDHGLDGGNKDRSSAAFHGWR